MDGTQASLEVLEESKKLILAGKADRVQVVLSGCGTLYRLSSETDNPFRDVGELFFLAMERFNRACDRRKEFDPDEEIKGLLAQ